MKLIECSASLIKEPNPFKKVEMAGRTCYKSEKNITDESAKRFFDTLAGNKHYAMMEHATFVFRVPKEVEIPITTSSKYINITKYKDTFWISGNLRAICEDQSELGTLMQYTLDDAMPGIAYNLYANDATPDAYNKPLLEIMNREAVLATGDAEIIANHLYTTMRFVCDRGVTHELVRHRPCSFAQESTRYVSYDRQEDVYFIKPYNFDQWSIDAKLLFSANLERAEEDYRRARELDLQPQQARALLPNAVKTEIVVTANDKEWKHIFNLRYFGTTGKPHPDMKELMNKAYPLYTSYNEPVKSVGVSSCFGSL